MKTDMLSIASKHDSLQDIQHDETEVCFKNIAQRFISFRQVIKMDMNM